MRNLLIVLVLVSGTCACFEIKEEDKCVELGGECVSIEDCDVLKQLIQKSSRGRAILSKNNCGFDGDVPRVCCPPREPNNCSTVEGTMGTCVAIEMCSYLLERSNSVRKDDMEYVERSRCAGPAGNSFCCDLTLVVVPNSTTIVNNDKETQNRFNTNCLNKVSNNNCSCGIQSFTGNKIFGGNITAIDEYPWLAILVYPVERRHQCGGSLINSFFILTAAHCLVTETKRPRGVNAVRLGEYNTTNAGEDCVEVAGGGEDCTEGAVTITINQIIVHPDYPNGDIFESNDIGLLKLSKSAPYTEFIRPICLPSSDVTKVAISSKTKLIAAGWGATSNVKHWSAIKLQVALPVMEQKTCEAWYSIAGKSLIWDKQFCAGGELNKDTCRGDSGGPLMYSDNDGKTHHIIGITSYGPSQCGIEGRPSIYTKVIEYIPWIVSTTEVQS